jgi:hypothetical protein
MRLRARSMRTGGLPYAWRWWDRGGKRILEGYCLGLGGEWRMSWGLGQKQNYGTEVP